jgi:hypothetical protein
VTLCDACHDKKHYKPDSIRNRRKRRRAARASRQPLLF